MARFGETHESFARDERVRGSSDRAFGFVFAAFFTLLFALAWWRGHADTWAARGALGLAALFLVIAVFAPAVLAPLNQLWTRFGLLLHAITSPVVLGLVFFLVVTPLGLLARLCGKDFLRLRWAREARTYWIARIAPGSTPEGLKRQF